MTIRRWIYLFMTTIACGMGSACLVGTIIFLIEPEQLTTLPLAGLPYNLVGTLLVGAMLGAFSHMGFFAYLTVQWFGQSFFRSRWAYVQVAITVLTLIYTVVFRMRDEEANVLPYLLLPLLILACTIPLTIVKVKQTSSLAAIPALFLLIAVTLLESVPALRLSNPYATAMMVCPLFICNAWQLLLLHRLLPKKDASPKSPPAPVSKTPRKKTSRLR